jgi:hypothetical protein
MNIVSVIGIPGAGKTTITTKALSLLECEGVELMKPFAHVRYGDIWHLGRHRPVFGGTDTLSMSVNPVARQFVTRAGQLDEPPRCIVSEGDRLANNAFLNDAAAAARDSGGQLVIALIDTPLAVARERAHRRAEEAGVEVQARSWWAGRVTKVDKLIALTPHLVVPIASEDADAAAVELHGLITA